MASFFDRPILNSPYAYPDRHWELDDDGQPTNKILPKRRESKLLTPVPPPAKSETSRFPCKELPHMPGSLTTPERWVLALSHLPVLPSVLSRHPISSGLSCAKLSNGLWPSLA
jgi:hypothetical protein